MDRVELTNLFDIYESLLTDREKEIFKYYYYEDLSLSEISENLNITRTGVFNTLNISFIAVPSTCISFSFR